MKKFNKTLILLFSLSISFTLLSPNTFENEKHHKLSKNNHNKPMKDLPYEI